MFKKLVPLNRETHATLKVKPIVFLEDKEKDEFRPVVLLGLEAGENLFLNEDGSWKASFVPAIIRRYPFALARLGEEADQFTVCLDEESDFVNQKDGDALFDEDGEPTEVVENVKRYLGEMQQMEAFTQQFCHFLSEHNLFNPLNMRVRYGSAMRNITGCYVINEERLYNLSDKLFLEIRDKRYLAPMFSHLTSLAQIERLARFKEDLGDTTPAPAADA